MPDREQVAAFAREALVLHERRLGRMHKYNIVGFIAFAALWVVEWRMKGPGGEWLRPVWVYGGSAVLILYVLSWIVVARTWVDPFLPCPCCQGDVRELLRDRLRDARCPHCGCLVLGPPDAPKS